jgi:hypothetical protein
MCRCVALSSLASTPPFLERALAAPVRAYFQAQGYRTFEEVYFNGRIADIVALRGDEVVGVELKLRDYREAHVQAMAYQVGCQRAFVALPLDAALRCLRRHGSAFRESGAGLLAVRMPEGEVSEVLAARLHENRFLPFVADGLRALGR